MGDLIKRLRVVDTAGREMMEAADELERKDKVIEGLTAEVTKYRQWFNDHASVLAVHHIGGFEFGSEFAITSAADTDAAHNKVGE